jgi:CDP-diglyceride synthetase
MKNKSLEFLIAMVLFTIIFGSLVYWVINEPRKAYCIGCIIAFFAACLAQIESNTRK